MEKNEILNNEEIQISKEGLDKYKERLDFLINTSREEVAEELQNAREQGDLSENAEYDEAKNKQAEIESEIIKIQDIVSRAKVIKGNSSARSSIAVGSKVDLMDVTNKKEINVEIVSDIETDPFSDPMKLSNNSPLVQAIIGKGVSDTKIKVIAPKTYEVVIKKIY